MTPMSSTGGGGGGGGGGAGFFATGFFFEVPALAFEGAGFEPAGVGFFTTVVDFLSGVAGVVAAGVATANTNVHAAANAAATETARDGWASMAAILRVAARRLSTR